MNRQQTSYTIDGQSVRYLSLQDAFRIQRDEWVQHVFGGVSYHSFKEGDYRFASRCEGDINLFVIGGSDSRRICGILRDIALGISGIPVIAVVTDISPQRRASLLKAGCDACLDSASTPPAEARLRIQAVLRRYEQVKEILYDKENIDNFLRRISYFSKLSAKEKMLLTHIASNNGKMFSTKSYLCIQLGSPHEPITQNHLSVIVSGIRKKLKPPAKILYCRDDNKNGYSLISIDAAE